MKKILLVADQKGWAFDAHCHQIKNRMPEYHIDIAYHRNNIRDLSNNYHLIYVLDPMPFRYPPARKTIMGLRNEFLYREHPNGPRGLYENGFPGRCVSIKDKCCIFHVVNRNLIEKFKGVVTDKPLLLAQHGVDENMFDRSKYTKVPSDRLRVSISGRGTPNKGFGKIRLACEEVGIDYISARYGRRKVPKSEMPKFYNQADVHVCFSKDEGLSNPIIEAGAMGVPVISTRSGGAMEMIEDGVSGFLIDRNVESLKIALEKMKDNDLRQRMADKFHEEIITNWTWKVRIEDYRKMFQLFFEMNK